MFDRRATSRWISALVILVTGSMLHLTPLLAQEAAQTPAVAATPAVGAASEAAPAAPATAGPRVNAPLERYEATLPNSRSEMAAPPSSGNHIIVLSTLALVLIVIIVVLLAVK